MATAEIIEVGFHTSSDALYTYWPTGTEDQGGEINCRARIKNTGTARTVFYVPMGFNDPNGNWVNLGYQAIIIDPNQEMYANRTFNVPSDAAVGDYDFFVRVTDQPPIDSTSFTIAGPLEFTNAITITEIIQPEERAFTFNVSTNVDPALFSLNGGAWRNSPDQITDWPEGRVVIDARKDGYLVQSQTLDGVHQGNYDIHFNLIPVTTPPPTNWFDEMVQSFWDILTYLNRVEFERIQNIYGYIIGDSLIFEEWELNKAQILDMIIPLNAMSKLFFGVNLSGTVEAFGSTQDYIDLALGLVTLVTAVKAPAIAAALAEKLGVSGSVTAASYMADDLLARSGIFSLIWFENLWAIATTNTAVKLAFGFAGSIAGADVLFSWLAEDNLATSIEFRSGEIRRFIDDGTYTKEQALEQYDNLEHFMGVTKTFLETSTTFNPLLWLFKPIMMANVDKAIETFNENRAIIEAYNPEIKGTLRIEASPADAKIQVEGQYPATGIFNQELPVGNYTTTVTAFQYVPQSFVAAVLENQQADYNITLVADDGTTPPPDEPPADDYPYQQDVTIALEKVTYNAWKYTINAIDSVTGENLVAQVLVDDVPQDFPTPMWIYLYPISVYNIKIRKSGYYQGEVTLTTPALPTA